MFRVCSILKSFHHLTHLVCQFLAFFLQICHVRRLWSDSFENDSGNAWPIEPQVGIVKIAHLDMVENFLEPDSSNDFYRKEKLVAELRERNNELHEQNSQLKLEIIQLRENKKKLSLIMIILFIGQDQTKIWGQWKRSCRSFSTTMGSGPSMLTCGENAKNKNIE